MMFPTENILIIAAKENMDNAHYLADMLSGIKSPYAPYVLQRMEEPTEYEVSEFSKRLHKDQLLKGSISAVVTDRDFYKNILPMSILEVIGISDHGTIPDLEITAKRHIIMTPFDDMGEDRVNFVRKELDDYFLNK